MGGFILRSTTENLLLWEQRINERVKSKMSISEWCKNNEISKGKFHYWNHKISKKQNLDNEMNFQLPRLTSPTSPLVKKS